MKHEYKENWMIVKIIIVFLVILTVALILYDLDWHNLYKKDKVKASDIFYAISTLCVATIGVFLLAARAKANDQIAQTAIDALKEQKRERSSDELITAVKMLAETSTVSRLSGIYILSELQKLENESIRKSANHALLMFMFEVFRDEYLLFRKALSNRLDTTDTSKIRIQYEFIGTLVTKTIEGYKYPITIQDCIITGYDDFEIEKIENVTFIRCIFYKAKFKNTTFYNCTFNVCFFDSSTFFCCKFVNCNFTNIQTIQNKDPQIRALFDTSGFENCKITSSNDDKINFFGCPNAGITGDISKFYFIQPVPSH